MGRMMLQEMMTYLKSRKKANLLMAAVNILVFLAMTLFGDPGSSRSMLKWGACYTPLILEGEYWRLLTAMYLHFSFLHLLYNMLALLTLGDLLERIAGTWRYLVIFLLGGILGNVVSLAMEQIPASPYYGRYAVSAGASGAVFAVIGAIFWIALRNRRLFGKSRVQRIALMTVLMTVEGFTQPGVDNAAHIGGLAAGFLLSVLLCSRLQGQKPSARRSNG